ncbi:alpha/beta fold hydrolase [Streptomyces chartreusis]|uniref:alpha/beta fold hydrolase n=1 Tax=Streptomyces chartreusis TaxID=1969 RepID=UPI00364F6EF6
MSTRNVDDVYELSPLQQGMLLHSLHDGAADMYFSQHTYTVEGPFDLDALVRAWHRVVEAHPALRTSFHWEGLDKPLQVVHREVSLPVHHHDWSDLDEQGQRERLEELRAEDRESGFDPAVAPLQRLQLIRLGADKHALIWAYHHLLLDGWSIPVFMNEVMTHYGALTVGAPPPPPAPAYRDYIAWLQRQDLQEAKDFWVRTLADVRPSHLVGLRPTDPQHGTGEVERRTVGLPVELSRGLRKAAARHRVTLGTVVQASWAIVLQHFTGRAEITFGCVSSGRPPELPQVDRMVGLFANTLPLTLPVPEDGELGPWLQEIQGTYAAMRRYEYTPLADIKKWGGAPGQALFESLLVLENYSLAVEAGAGVGSGRLAFRTHALYDKIDVPLTLTLAPEPVSELQLLIHRERFAPGFIDEVFTCLQAVLQAIVTSDTVGPVALAAGPPLATASAGQAQPVVPARGGGEPTLPATPREESITEVFRDVLGIDGIDVTASFFDLGGDSFDAVRAIKRIDGATVGMLAGHPSVRALAAALEASGGPEGILRRLTPAAAQTPTHTLVCIPFGGGSAVSYQPLGAALPPDFTLLAASLPGHEPGGSGELRPLEDVAQECADAVLATTEGPVAVYGHSAGVALAVETARRLETAGRTVERLFVAASFPFYEGGSLSRALNQRRENADALALELRGLQTTRRAGAALSEEDLAFVTRAASHDISTGRRYFSERWARNSSTPPLAAPITFVVGTNDPATVRFQQRLDAWERFGSSVDLATVPLGEHYFHQQQPETLAKIIERSLAESSPRH